MTSALRSPDPYQTISGGWLIRKLSPDSNPIRIEGLPKERDEETLLQAMGTDIANVHLGGKRHARFILRDLRRRDLNWLRTAAKRTAKATLKEWKEYRD